jgi:hypothetical protein
MEFATEENLKHLLSATIKEMVFLYLVPKKTVAKFIAPDAFAKHHTTAKQIIGSFHREVVLLHATRII